MLKGIASNPTTTLADHGALISSPASDNNLSSTALDSSKYSESTTVDLVPAYQER
jgi:hypothetical protein